MDDESIEDAPILSTTPILSVEQVADCLYDALHANTSYFKAFYSSVYGGITTDPAFMSVPVDDHLVHRGHGVFDTAIVVDGHMYQLDQHIVRLARSAAAARVPLPASPEQLARIVLDTAAASRCKNGFLRYWLSAGRGGFTLSGHDCLQPEFYCIFYSGPHTPLDEIRGWSVKSSPVPNKPGVFAELKSVNYLQNALNLMDAQDDGLDQGVFVRPDGTIAEGPNLNVGIVTAEGVVRVPPFEECLAGVTMSRIMEMIPLYGDALEEITGVEQGPITMDDVFAAREVFMTGGSIPVAAVTKWDNRRIGDGTVGVSVLSLRQMILNDMRPSRNSNQHRAVPYGILTGMPDDVFGSDV